MRKLKSIIIDDDPLITDLIAHFVDKTEEIEYCVTCNDSVAGLKLLGNGSFDLLFLDLNMPTLDGKSILELKQDESKIIMVTSDKEFAVDSYRYDNVIDYIVKPIKYDRFLEAVKRYQKSISIERLPHNQDFNLNQIMIKDGNRWIPIAVEKILFIKSDSNYCVVNCIDKTVMSLVNLKTLLNKLPSHFIQCHRSYIVNTQNIDHFTKEEITIREYIIPISNKHKSVVFDFMNASF